jgi:hypothetical protein
VAVARIGIELLYVSKLLVQLNIQTRTYFIAKKWAKAFYLFVF